MKYKKWISTLLRIIVGLGLLVFLFWKTDVHKILTILIGTEPHFIIFSILLFSIAVFVISYRWKILLATHSVSIPFSKTTAFYLIGFFFNNFLPTLIGLDMIRAVYASNSYGKKAECFASVISEKVIGLLAILLLGVFFLPPFLKKNRFIIFIFLGFVIFTILFILGILFFPKRKSFRIFNWFFKIRFILQLKDKVRRLYDALYYYKNKKIVVVKTLLLSFCYQLILITMVFFIGRALSCRIPFYYYLAFIPVINIGSMIPITPNGIGIREFLYVYLFKLAGVESSMAILISLLYFIITMLVSLSGAIIFIFGTRKGEKKEVEKSIFS